MYNQDLTIVDGKNMLNIRVSGIIIKENRVLMVKNTHSDYIYSLGGRLKFGESAQEGVVREVEEEIGMRLEVDRLGFVHENFFVGSTPSKMNTQVYELSFYFYMKVPEEFSVETGRMTSDDDEQELVWVDWHGAQPFYPEFFREELDHPSMEIKHILTDGRRKGAMSETAEV